MRDDNVIPLFTTDDKHQRSEMLHGWVPGADGYWRHNGQEPLVLLMQRKMEQIVEETSRTIWLQGYWRGVNATTPWIIVAFVAGAAVARWVL